MNNKLNLSKKKLTILKQYIRSNASKFLRDPNITSIGIGGKSKDGKQTNEACLQFTVNTKSVIEGVTLEDLNSHEIPKEINLGEFSIVTDVLERQYKLSYELIQSVPVNKRKIKLDPMLPGISVSNRKGTAGTLGCIVYDQYTNIPYILSNWHVLHGNRGALGDHIVQPGPYDDNRVNQNRAGTLVRSYLGEAGDCAIASIEGRGYSENIYKFGTPVEQLCEVEYGDHVIKSGRTTNVTHGIVTRINVVTQLNYGHPTGLKKIGCFEISVHNDHKPVGGEISSGGDSGAAWMIADGENATNIMAGLHFAGETSDNPHEHALACYPKSVFEKLEIKLKR